MKYAVIAARVLMGLLFAFSGVSKILHFGHHDMSPSDGTTLMMIMTTHGWLNVVGLFEIVGGLLLVVGRYVPLGLALLAPVIVNILIYHTLFQPSGLPIGIACAVLEVFLIVAYRSNFIPLFEAAPKPAPSV